MYLEYMSGLDPASNISQEQVGLASYGLDMDRLGFGLWIFSRRFFCCYICHAIN